MANQVELIRHIRFKMIPSPLYYVVGFMSLLRLLVFTELISFFITICEILLVLPLILRTISHLNESKYEMLNYSIVMILLSSELLVTGLIFCHMLSFSLLWILLSIMAVLSGIIYESINWNDKLYKWSLNGKIDFNNHRIYIIPHWRLKEDGSLTSQYIIISVLLLLCILVSIIISIILKNMNDIFILLPLSLIGFGISGTYLRRYIWIIMYQSKYKIVFFNELGPSFFSRLENLD